MQIKSIMFDANVNLLTEKIEEFYVSPYFLTLHQNEQKELKLQLETLAKIRNSWIEILIEYYQPQATTRMSPGDRMIWSDIAKQMNHKQQSNLIDASLYGIGIVCGPIPAGVVGAIALAKSIFLAIVDIDKNKDRRKTFAFADLYFLKALGTRQ